MAQPIVGPSIFMLVWARMVGSRMNKFGLCQPCAPWPAEFSLRQQAFPIIQWCGDMKRLPARKQTLQGTLGRKK